MGPLADVAIGEFDVNFLSAEVAAEEIEELELDAKGKEGSCSISW